MGLCYFPFKEQVMKARYVFAAVFCAFVGTVNAQTKEILLKGVWEKPEVVLECDDREEEIMLHFREAQKTSSLEFRKFSAIIDFVSSPLTEKLMKVHGITDATNHTPYTASIKKIRLYTCHEIAQEIKKILD